MKRRSVSLVTVEMQIKTILRYRFTLTNMANTEKTDHGKCRVFLGKTQNGGKHCEKEFSSIGVNETCVYSMNKQFFYLSNRNGNICPLKN